MGYKRMPKTQDEVLRKIDRLVDGFLHQGRSVIFDSVNRYSFRRQQMYGVASGCGAKVVTLECVCSEKTAKERMRSRPKADGLLADPNYVRVYDKLAKLWENISIDFKYPGQDHVSYVVYDSEKNTMEVKLLTPGMGRFLNKVEKILCANNPS